MTEHQHISFRKEWELTPQICYFLGECDAFVEAIKNIPLKPEYRDKLLQVSLIKGAQATTAIEGNTLSEEEIERLQEGWRLPPSKEYLEVEVRNIIDAFNTLLKEIVFDGTVRLITPDLVRDFHQMISKNLGEHIDSIPGRFREDNRRVGAYLAPDYKHVPEMVQKLCDWLRQEFHFEKEQNFATSVLQAIVAHVYIERIHPFADGNGRTGRLIEFYILLRAGLPSIVSHILSNFYNKTRPEYYRQLDKARKSRDLSEFLEYALQGFRDGLRENMLVIQENQLIIFWQNYVFESFKNVKYTKKEAFRRKRELMLGMPFDRSFTIDDITLLNPRIAQVYAKVKRPTVSRDLKELQEMNLLRRDGRQYRANVGILKAMLPSSRKS